MHRDAVCFMSEITMIQNTEKSFQEMYEEFVILRIARGVSDSMPTKQVSHDNYSKQPKTCLDFF